MLEHIEGPRLSTLIRRTRQLDVDQVMALAVQVAGALHYLHGRGVVQLDVKPSNIIMSGPPRLIDLSVACSFEEAARLRTPVGTDAYMAPEQSAPTEAPPVTAAADVWGLGATLYEAVSGRRAFPRSSDEDPYPQRHHRPEALDVVVPAEVRATIMACLDPDASSRPSARDVVSALEPAVALPRRIVLGRVRPRWS